MTSGSHFESDADLRRYETLLEMADLIVHYHSLPHLFLAMADRLRQVVAADVAHFSLHDPTDNVMRLHSWKGAEFSTLPTVLPVEASPSGWTWQNQEPLVVNDFQSEARLPLVLLTNEKLYLEEEIHTQLNFEEIVGESPALKKVRRDRPALCAGLEPGVPICLQGYP